MQLHITTDYAIRIISYLYLNKGQLSTAKSMAEQLGITYKYFMKVINQLREAGVVQSIQGCNGGYLLTPTGEEMTLYDIICIMQGEIVLNRCLECDEFCSRNATCDCPYRKAFAGIQEDIIQTFRSKKAVDYVS